MCHESQWYRTSFADIRSLILVYQSFSDICGACTSRKLTSWKWHSLLIFKKDLNLNGSDINKKKYGTSYIFEHAYVSIVFVLYITINFFLHIRSLIMYEMLLKRYINRPVRAVTVPCQWLYCILSDMFYLFFIEIR